MQRHEVDVFSLVFGSMFLVFGALFLLTDASLAHLELAWVWPLLVIGAGLLMLAAAVGQRRSASTEESMNGVEEEPVAASKDAEASDAEVSDRLDSEGSDEDPQGGGDVRR
ncbi:MAG: hypothetical protein ACRDKZ_14090 [Actinomycetota bacterium]